MTLVLPTAQFASRRATARTASRSTIRPRPSTRPPGCTRTSRRSGSRSLLELAARLGAGCDRRPLEPDARPPARRSTLPPPAPLAGRLGDVARAPAVGARRRRFDPSALAELATVLAASYGAARAPASAARPVPSAGRSTRSSCTSSRCGRRRPRSAALYHFHPFRHRLAAARAARAGRSSRAALVDPAVARPRRRARRRDRRLLAIADQVRPARLPVRAARGRPRRPERRCSRPPSSACPRFRSAVSTTGVLDALVGADSLDEAALLRARPRGRA